MQRSSVSTRLGSVMPVLAAVPAWFLFVIPDLAAGAAGIALAREVDRRLVPGRA